MSATATDPIVSIRWLTPAGVNEVIELRFRNRLILGNVGSTVPSGRNAEAALRQRLKSKLEECERVTRRYWTAGGELAGDIELSRR